MESTGSLIGRCHYPQESRVDPDLHAALLTSFAFHSMSWRENLRATSGGHFGGESRKGVLWRQRLTASRILQVKDHTIGYPLRCGGGSVRSRAGKKISIRRVHVHLD